MAAEVSDLTIQFPSPAIITPVILRDYAVNAPIPTSFVLPCAGSGTVAFVPQPTSPTAHPATVTVTFVGQP